MHLTLASNSTINSLNALISQTPSAPLPALRSSTKRHRVEQEIRLLQSLADDPATAVPNLWTLWYSEKGAGAAAELAETDVHMSNPATYHKAEDTLRSLVDRYPDFVEVSTLTSLKHCKVVVELGANPPPPPPPRPGLGSRRCFS